MNAQTFSLTVAAAPERVNDLYALRRLFESPGA